MLDNIQAGKPDGECHRKETAHCHAGMGKGEMVVAALCSDGAIAIARGKSPPHCW